MGSVKTRIGGTTGANDTPNSIFQRLVPALADVPGVNAIVLGGSRARGTATENSDYDLGLYYSAAKQLDTDRLLEAVRDLVDEPGAAAVTPVGEWGPWIVGGAWLSIAGRKVDLLYRNSDEVARVVHSCRAGLITMDYQPGHPYGFCSAIWMGEVALCRPVHDPRGAIAELKKLTSPYPEPLRDALIRRFQWEVLFSIENGDRARRANAYRGLHLSGFGLRRTSPVRPQWTLSHQRKGSAARSRKVSVDRSQLDGTCDECLAAHRAGRI